MTVQVANVELSTEFKFFGAYAEAGCSVGRVVESDRSGSGPLAQYVLDKDVALALVLGDVRLQPQRVLVNRNQLLVGNDVHSLLRYVLHIAAEQQWGTHYAPDAEMRFLFGVAQTQTVLPERRRLDVVAYREHIHIVVMPVRSVCGKIKVLADYVFDGGPYRPDVTGDSPRISYLIHPGPRIVPAADVYLYRLTGHAVYDFPDACVALGLIQPEVAAAAVVYLDEVEVPFVEIPLRVGNIVSVKSGSESVQVVVVARTAGVMACIRVDSRLEAEGMYAVNKLSHPFTALRKALRVGNHTAEGVPVAEESVIDVDEAVTGVKQPFFFHQFCLMGDDGVRDIDHIGIPGTPSHHRRLDGSRPARTSVNGGNEHDDGRSQQ